MKQSPIFVRVYDLLRWLLPATAKFPRQQRFILAEAIQRAAFSLQDALIEATIDKSVRRLRRADAELAKLRTYLRLSRDLGFLADRQLAHVTPMVDEIGRLLGAWRKSSERRSATS